MELCSSLKSGNRSFRKKTNAIPKIRDRVYFSLSKVSTRYEEDRCHPSR